MPPPADDDWDELNRELGVDKPAARAEDADPDDAPAEDADGDADADSADGEEAGGEPKADDGSGEGPKRRRRRRRKKKGGPAGAAGEAPDAAAEPAEPAAAPAPRYASPARVVAPRPAVAEAEVEVEDEEAEGESADRTDLAAAEEDAGGELLRDLIANWDVPSWDEVIGGLHRPR